MQSQIHICPLCQSNGEEFYNQQFQKCSRCQSIFRCPEFFISATKEQARYKEHNNDINDERYQEFVSPIVEKIITNHLPAEK